MDRSNNQYRSVAVEAARKARGRPTEEGERPNKRTESVLMNK